MSAGPVQPGRASDTIFAVASGAGRAAVAVMRLSGPDSRPILAGLCKVPTPRVAALRRLRARDGETLDRALVLWLPGPASYTGEDSAELHLHGGRAVIAGVTQALVEAGARPADAGEFTRRAYLAGRMGLLEAEAIADLSAAETEAQRRQALRQMQGEMGAVAQDWAVRLTRCLAFAEALIDFPDDNLPPNVERENRAAIVALGDEVKGALASAERGRKVAAGLVFVIAGPPNAGKSSLFNALAGRDVAIVSARPGTTRDSLEAVLELGGVKVTLVDTAGLREADDEIEAAGIRRAREHIEAADLVIALADGGVREPETPGCLPVRSKCDVAAAPKGVLGVSTLTGQGIGELLGVLGQRARALVHGERDPLLSRARHVAVLRDVHAALLAAVEARWPELQAEELRLARASLGRLTGQTDVDAVLDMVFSSFCIGK